MKTHYTAMKSRINSSNYTVVFCASSLTAMLLAADFLNIAFVPSELLSKWSTRITGSAHIQHINDVKSVCGLITKYHRYHWLVQCVSKNNTLDF